METTQIRLRTETNYLADFWPFPGSDCTAGSLLTLFISMEVNRGMSVYHLTKYHWSSLMVHVSCAGKMYHMSLRTHIELIGHMNAA